MTADSDSNADDYDYDDIDGIGVYGLHHDINEYHGFDDSGIGRKWHW